MAGRIDDSAKAASDLSASSPSTANAKAGWPGTVLRTYLWARSLQQEPPIYDDDDCDFSIACHAYSDSTPANPTNLPLSPIDALGQDHCLCDFSGHLYERAILRSSLPAFPPLRHTASHDVTARHSLPGSFQCLLPPSTPHTLSAMTSALLEVPRKDARGRGVHSSCLSPLTASPSPSIILTPPCSPNARRDSVISILSSSSGFPSEPASSLCDGDFFESDSDSESAHNDIFEEQAVSPQNKNLLHAGHSQSCRTGVTEDIRVPVRCVSESAVGFATSLRTAQEILTIDPSEYLHGPTLLRPGAHGVIVPSSLVLSELLALHAQYNPNGCHLFDIQGETNGKGARYQYHGFYRVIRRGVSSSNGDQEKSQISERRKEPFFLQFLRFDWDLLGLMERHMKYEARNVLVRKSSSDRSPETESIKRYQTSKQALTSSSRIVTVDGVDFEIAPTPIAWNHGSYRDAQRER
ncbi:hypothetical protein DFH11DRAFT_252837 [Phellopilus nigrolimitatus]|nr:hypothetical protein DFH11DRAFT_252837 [Phellopilus nigrolimitatus]